MRASRKREAVKHGLIGFVLLFAFLPFYLMIVISFKDNKQFVNNPWLFDGLSELWEPSRAASSPEAESSF